MHARPYLVQLGRAFHHRGRHHVGNDGIERLVHGHAPGLPLRQLLLAIAGLGHGQVQRGDVARMLGIDQLLAVGDGVHLRHVRRLVDQGFHDEGRVRRADGAPPQHGHVRLGRVHGQLHRQGVRLAHAFDHGTVDAIFHHEGFERRASHDGLAHDGVVPGEDLALGVEADLRAVYM
ncbi:hypothetical protein D3C72_1006050 [compost metagenome]